MANDRRTRQAADAAWLLELLPLVRDDEQLEQALGRRLSADALRRVVVAAVRRKLTGQRKKGGANG